MKKETESIVYFGINGIGKTKELEKMKSKFKDKSFFFNTSKQQVPDELSKESGTKNTMKNELDNFLKRIISKLSGSKKNIEDEKFLNILDILKHLDSTSNENHLKKTNEFYQKIKVEIENINNDEHIKTENNLWQINKNTINFSPLSIKLKKPSKDHKDYGDGLKFYSVIRIISKILKVYSTVFNEQEDENSDISNTILLIDEPERFLHPPLIKKIALELKKINNYVSIYISSHSPDFINYFYHPNKTELWTKKDHNDEWQQIKINEIYNKVFKGVSDYNIFRRNLIIEMFFYSNFILVEGNNDVLIFEKLLIEKGVANTLIIPTNGKPRMKGTSDIIFNILKNKELWLNENSKVILVYDKDDDQETNCKLRESAQDKDRNVEIIEFVPNLEKELNELGKDLKLTKHKFDPFDTQIWDKIKKALEKKEPNIFKIIEKLKE